MKKNLKKLTLNRETLRQITPEETSGAVGGATLGCPQTGGTCVTCLLNCLTHVTCTWG
jgi:hypothetical protein